MRVQAIGLHRRVRRWRSIVVLTCAVALLGAASAAPGAEEEGRGANELSLWGGGSVGATTMIGKSTGFDFGLAAVRYGRRLWSNDALSFDWTIDAIPLAFLTLDRSPGAESGHRESVYGAGLSPIGWRLDVERLRWVRPYFAANGGFLYFEDRVPARGVKFNFTYDFGVGAQVPVTPDTAVTLGYSYFHISNGGLGNSNPGFDANLLYLGISLFR
jgi:opacity protein-like surface antigen